MPTYEYKCDNCDHSFEIVQSMKDKHKRKCPNCKKSKLKRVMGTPLVFVKGDPQSIGHWAERNTQKMGSYELSEKRELENKNDLSLQFSFNIGDINQDDSIDILDIVELVNTILNGDNSGIEFYLSDINGDGVLNNQDLIALVNLILN